MDSSHNWATFVRFPERRLTFVRKKFAISGPYCESMSLWVSEFVSPWVILWNLEVMHLKKCQNCLNGMPVMNENFVPDTHISYKTWTKWLELNGNRDKFLMLEHQECNSKTYFTWADPWYNCRRQAIKPEFGKIKERFTAGIGMETDKCNLINRCY